MLTFFYLIDLKPLRTYHLSVSICSLIKDRNGHEES